ncbi:hypothetical protein MFRU_014g00860 [Monilinia fructicola]|nr:hypothetical protein MFRU_014g00860 [Monilinia fructicola]
MKLSDILGYFERTHPAYLSELYQPKTWQEWRDWQQRKDSKPTPAQFYKNVEDYEKGKLSIETLKAAHDQILAKKYGLLRRSLPAWQTPCQLKFFTPFEKEFSAKFESMLVMDKNSFQCGKTLTEEQSMQEQLREERQTLAQRRGKQQLTLQTSQKLQTLPQRPISKPIHRKEHKITQQVKPKVKRFPDFIDTMMWTEDQDRELRMHFTKERLIKKLVDYPAIRDTLQALINESRALSLQSNGGETKNTLADIGKERNTIAGDNNHGGVSSRKKITQSIHPKEMHPKRINTNATSGQATRNLPPMGEPIKPETLREWGLFIECQIKNHDGSM